MLNRVACEITALVKMLINDYHVYCLFATIFLLVIDKNNCEGEK